jgi:hypothetical protein
MKLKITEKQIEKQILQYLNMLSGCMAWKVESIGTPIQGRFRLQKNRLLGQADVIVL